MKPTCGSGFLPLFQVTFRDEVLLREKKVNTYIYIRTHMALVSAIHTRFVFYIRYSTVLL